MPIYGSDYGLVLYLPFEEGAGTIAYDQSPLGNDGTFLGAGQPAWSDGKFGKAVLFDGTNDYIALASDYVFTNNNTLVFWAKIEAQDYLGIVTGNLGAFAYIRFGSGAGLYDDNILVETDTNGDTLALVFDSSITVGTWYHFAITQDGSNVWRLYINGVLQADTGTSTDNELTMRRLGQGRQNTDHFKGNMDEFRIYNRLLTAEEMRILWLNGQGGMYSRSVTVSDNFRVLGTDLAEDFKIVDGEVTIADLAGNAGWYVKVDANGKLYVEVA